MNKSAIVDTVLMELLGEQNLPKRLTTFLDERRKCGRPFSLLDAELWRRRDQLTHLLGRFWGVVGWDLQQAKSSANIQVAFTPLTKFSDEIRPFLHAPTRRANAKQLRLRRKEVNECSDKLNELRRIREEKRRALGMAETAFHQCRGTAEETKVQNELQLRTMRFQEIEAEYERIAEQCERVQRCLEAEEGHFAQSELLDFIRSGRYSPTPKNFAGAMAGLPFMSWRQSAIRCSQQPAIGDSVVYEQFKAIETALRTERPGDATVRVYAWLATPRNATYAVSELRKNWYYLRRAIIDVQKALQHPRSIPYRIIGVYQHNIQSSTATDVVLAETERI